MIDVSGYSVRQSQHAPNPTPNLNPVTLWTSELSPHGALTEHKMRAQSETNITIRHRKGFQEQNFRTIYEYITHLPVFRRTVLVGPKAHETSNYEGQVFTRSMK